MSSGNTHWKWRIDAAGIAAVVLLSGAAYFAGFKPLLDRQAGRVAEKAMAAQKRSEASQLASTLTTVRGQLVKIRQAADLSAIQLQSMSHLNQRLSEVTALATRVGLQVDEVQPGGVVHTDRYEQVAIQLAGAGTYPVCAEFLRQLHEKFPDTGVTSMELQGRASDPQGRGVFRLSLIWFAAPSTRTAEVKP